MAALKAIQISSAIAVIAAVMKSKVSLIPSHTAVAISAANKPNAVTTSPIAPVIATEEENIDSFDVH
ncbi:unnamed protein product, partial [marine sediment metagenome]